MARNTGIKQTDYNNLKNVLLRGTDDGLIIIQRTEAEPETVYFANGHMIARFPYVIYQGHMDRNTFPELEPGTITGCRFRSGYKKWFDSDCDIAKMYHDSLEAAERSILTKLTYDLGDGKTARLIVCGRQLAAINSVYYDAARRITQTGSHVYGTSAKNPVFILDRARSDEYYGFMILPVNLAAENKKLRDFIAA